MRLRNTESFGDRSLSKMVLVDQFVQANRGLHAELPVFRIGQAEISKNINNAATIESRFFTGISHLVVFRDRTKPIRPY